MCLHLETPNEIWQEAITFTSSRYVLEFGRKPSNVSRCVGIWRKEPSYIRNFVLDIVSKASMYRIESSTCRMESFDVSYRKFRHHLESFHPRIFYADAAGKA